MQEDMMASSELYSAFPQYKSMSFTGSIPTLIVPKSKYSSTETELSSDDEESSHIGNRLSTSSWSGSPRRKFRRRRRRKIASDGNSSSSLNLSIRSSISLNSAGVSITGRSLHKKIELEENEVTDGSWIVSEKRTRNLPVVNSVNDLKHATGRHRGISGSPVPAVDSALFAMFYITDIFDGLLADSPLSLHPHYVHINSSLKRDLLSILRREIVYSLRINYFCPASKVVKLMQLMEKHYPLHHIQDAADFLDLLFGELLKHPPFLNYSNGSTDFIHPLHLENYLTRQYYYQPLALTVQQLLCQRDVFSALRIRKNHLKKQGGINFATVPYPALILKVIRKAPPDKNVDDDDGLMYYWDQSSETHHHQHKRPIIPNLWIDITDLISTNCNDNSSLQQSYSSNWNENMSFSKSHSSMSSFMSEKALSYEAVNDVDQGAGESRIFKGLKSAWKVMFKYLEDLSASTSYINPDESASMSADRNNKSSATTTSTHTNNSTRRMTSNNSNDDEHRWSNPARKNNLSSSSSSLFSFSGSRLSLSRQSRNELEESFSASVPKQIQVKMELIAIICKSRSEKSMEDHFEKKIGQNNNSFSGYSVYCKAGKDVVDGNMRDKMQHAPWVLYQSRHGTAPQVALIENFGKWMDSLEKHHESLSLYEVPMEIRRVLEDSHLFIYKRLE